MKFIGILLGLVVTLAVTGALYQWAAAAHDRKTYPAPGVIHDIDGIAMHIDCRGAGQPTVVLEAGLALGSTSWVRVHDAVAQHTRVCAYDRAGLGWSAPDDQILSAPVVAERLHRLLRAEGIGGPQILVGMSAGGLLVREYYRRFPQDIVGMVLVDSSHEQQGDRLPPLDVNQRKLLRACALLQPIGVVRAFGLMARPPNTYESESQQTALATAMANQTHSCRTLGQEADGFELEVHDPEPPASLGSLPLIVLSQGKAEPAMTQFGMSLHQIEALTRRWDELQRELTALSTAGVRRIAHDSGHFIQTEQPQIVIDAVLELIGG